MRVDVAAFDRLDKAIRTWIEKPTVIRPTLHRRANGPNYWYRLQIVEDFGSSDDAGNYIPSTKLDECINWVGDKLKNWPNCYRKAWDMWDFESKHDAEKFITVFHLSWQQ